MDAICLKQQYICLYGSGYKGIFSSQDFESPRRHKHIRFQLWRSREQNGLPICRICRIPPSPSRNTRCCLDLIGQDGPEQGPGHYDGDLTSSPDTFLIHSHEQIQSMHVFQTYWQLMSLFAEKETHFRDVLMHLWNQWLSFTFTFSNHQHKVAKPRTFWQEQS